MAPENSSTSDFLPLLAVSWAQLAILNKCNLNLTKPGGTKYFVGCLGNTGCVLSILPTWHLATKLPDGIGLIVMERGECRSSFIPLS